MIQCSIFILITEILRHNPIISKEVFLNELSFYWSENSVFSLKIWLHTLFFWIKLTKFYLNFTNRTGGAWWAAVHAVAKSQTRLSDFTFTFHFSFSCIGEGNGNPLQCSCLENPRDRGAWWAAVYGVSQSRTRLKLHSSSSSNRTIQTFKTKKAKQ